MVEPDVTGAAPTGQLLGEPVPAQMGRGGGVQGEGTPSLPYRESASEEPDQHREDHRDTGGRDERPSKPASHQGHRTRGGREQRRRWAFQRLRLFPRLARVWPQRVGMGGTGIPGGQESRWGKPPTRRSWATLSHSTWPRRCALPLGLLERMRIEDPHSFTFPSRCPLEKADSRCRAWAVHE